MEREEGLERSKGILMGTEAPLTSAQSNLTPIIIDKPSTTPMYNLIKVPEREPVAYDNKELLDKVSTILPPKK